MWILLFEIPVLVFQMVEYPSLWFLAFLEKKYVIPISETELGEMSRNISQYTKSVSSLFSSNKNYVGVKSRKVVNRPEDRS